MNELQKINETSPTFIDYLDSLVTVETHFNELKGIKTSLLQSLNVAEQIAPVPQKEKAVVNWKLAIAIPVVGFILTAIFGNGLILLLSLIAVGGYLFSRFHTANRVYRHLYSGWEAQSEEKHDIQYNCKVQIPSVESMISECQSTLTKLYNAGPIDRDYRNLPAVATFYDWFRKGMTSSLSRVGSDKGAYNMYEEKLRHKELMGSLDEIKKNVAAIRNEQARLADAVGQINSNVASIGRELSHMSQTMDVMAANSLAGLYYSSVMADNASALNTHLGIQTN